VDVNGKPCHVVIKDSFGGREAALDSVTAAPKKCLAALTVTVQREAGYDAENMGWFWVKYKL
jgi:predicted GNAT superfamily acetyltransferase